MLTKNGVEKILNRIWETGGLSADMEDDISKLKAEFDEREGVLRKYGEVYDGEDKDEYDWQDNGGEYRGKYEELKERYKNRFMRGEPDRRNGDKDDFETVKDGEEKDVKKDSTPHTWDELLATSSNAKQDKEVNE